MTKCQKDPTCGIFLKRGLIKDLKNDTSLCRTHKYKKYNYKIHKYTNTQIQHKTKCQKDPTCGIFLKRGLFRGIKNDIHMCQTRKYKIQIHKYTNAQIQLGENVVRKYWLVIFLPSDQLHLEPNSFDLSSIYHQGVPK